MAGLGFTKHCCSPRGFEVISLQKGPTMPGIEPRPPAWLTQHKKNVAKCDVYSKRKSDLLFGKNFSTLLNKHTEGTIVRIKYSKMIKFCCKKKDALETTLLHLQYYGALLYIHLK